MKVGANAKKNKMKKEKEKIDKLIKETLSQEEAKFYDELDEQNLFAKVGEVYRGKMGWLAIVMNIVHLVIFGVFIYLVIQFLNAEDTFMLIKWASSGFICLVVMVMLKLYMWMQMDKNDLLRELKRLELQMTTLSQRTDK